LSAAVTGAAVPATSASAAAAATAIRPFFMCFPSKAAELLCGNPMSGVGQIQGKVSIYSALQ
jgi:hypothetical protein